LAPTRKSRRRAERIPHQALALRFRNAEVGMGWDFSASRSLAVRAARTVLCNTA